MALRLMRLCPAHVAAASCIISRARSVFSVTRKSFHAKQGESSGNASGDGHQLRYEHGHLSSLVSDHEPHVDSCDIEVVDNDAWQASCCLPHSLRGLYVEPENPGLPHGIEAEILEDNDRRDAGYSPSLEIEPDLDELDTMRIHGNLFYKIDRGSKEFEEYRYDFHRKKRDSKRREAKNVNTNKITLNHPEPKKEEIQRSFSVSKTMDDNKVSSVDFSSSGIEKKRRIPTFNQLTAPYHLPFCLDIYISKSSVRACIIHRVTSKVVAVAHSISKDMKFDLTSTRNAQACAAVGAILAQRALDDDIHNVVYTPRTGEKLEGKLRTVLEAVIRNGLDVKVKLKQMKRKKASGKP